MNQTTPLTPTEIRAMRADAHAVRTEVHAVRAEPCEMKGDAHAMRAEDHPMSAETLKMHSQVHAMPAEGRAMHLPFGGLHFPILLSQFAFAGMHSLLLGMPIPFAGMYTAEFGIHPERRERRPVFPGMNPKEQVCHPKEQKIVDRIPGKRSPGVRNVSRRGQSLPHALRDESQGPHSLSHFLRNPSGSLPQSPVASQAPTRDVASEALGFQSCNLEGSGVESAMK